MVEVSTPHRFLTVKTQHDPKLNKTLSYIYSAVGCQTTQAVFLTTHNYLLKAYLNSTCLFITEPSGAYVPYNPVSLVELLKENRRHDLTLTNQ